MKLKQAIKKAADYLEAKLYNDEYVSKCPFCESDKHKFYLNAHTGLYSCKRASCAESGNLTTLFKKLGFTDTIEYPEEEYNLKEVVKKEPISTDGIRELRETDTHIIDYMMSRGISYDTLKKHNVFYSEKYDAMCFVNYDKANKPIGVVYRKVDKKIRLEKGSDLALWGKENLDLSKSDTLYIAEGHPDALTLMEMGIDNVVSVPNGAAAHDWINKDWDVLNKFKRIVLCYDNDEAGKNAIEKVKNRLDFATLFVLEYGNYKDVNDMYMGDVEGLYRTVRNPKEISMDGFISLREVKTNKDRLSNMSSCGLAQLDRIFGGFENSECTIIAAASGNGKALPLTSTLYGVSGEIKMSDIKVGDKIFGEDGNLHNVTGVYPQGKKEVVEVVFSDGSVAECCEDHIWTVYKRTREPKGCKDYYERDKAWPTDDYTVAEMIEQKGLVPPTSYYRIPTTEPVNFATREHIIPPYVLGVLIGDGCLTGSGIKVAIAEKFIHDKLKSLIPENYNLVSYQGDGYGYHITGVNGKNIYTREVKRLKLDTLSYKKSIPDEYMFDSVENRLELLRGIFDTDGTIKKQNTSISTTSTQLKDDIVRLCQSLGMIATVSAEKSTRYTSGVCYRVTINFREGFEPFSSDKHRSRYVKRTTEKLPRRFIREFRRTGRYVEMQCIQVDNPTKLFLYDDFFVTHNTTVVANLANGFMANGESVAIWSGELNNQALKTWIYGVIAGQKAIVSVDNPFRSGDKIAYLKEEYEKKIDKAVEGKLFVYDGNKNNAFTMLKHFELLHKKNGVTVFFIDNGSILDMSVPGKDKYVGEEEFAKRLAAFLRENPVKVFLVMHPTKTVLNSDPNYIDSKGRVKRPEKYNQYQVKGSSALVNLAYNILFLNRATEHHKTYYAQLLENQLKKAGRENEIPNMVKLINNELSLIMYLDKNRMRGFVGEDALFGYSNETRRIYGLTSKEEDLSKEVISCNEVEQDSDGFEEIGLDDF